MLIITALTSCSSRYQSNPDIDRCSHFFANEPLKYKSDPFVCVNQHELTSYDGVDFEDHHDQALNEIHGMKIIHAHFESTVSESYAHFESTVSGSDKTRKVTYKAKKGQEYFFNKHASYTRFVDEHIEDIKYRSQTECSTTYSKCNVPYDVMNTHLMFRLPFNVHYLKDYVEKYTFEGGQEIHFVYNEQNNFLYFRYINFKNAMSDDVFFIHAEDSGFSLYKAYHDLQHQLFRKTAEKVTQKDDELEKVTQKDDVLEKVVTTFNALYEASPYQQISKATDKHSYGFNSIAFDDNIFKVYYSGNRNSKISVNEDYALLRAAEVMIEHDLAYFEILESAELKHPNFNVSKIGLTPGIQSTDTSVVLKNTLYVKGYKDHQGHENIYNASFIVKTIKERYKM
tara:strand:- start:546 stop:1739 length:1194 start_codon:yes stop_codon:yes gene_type:complete